MAIFNTGCWSRGIKEPDFYIYTILDTENLHGENSINPDLKSDVKVIDAIGWQCADPHGFASTRSHHEILHKRINELQEKVNACLSK